MVQDTNLLMIAMGYSEDIMHDFIMKDTRTLLPAGDGWQAREITSKDANSTIYLYSRRNRGKEEKAAVMVSLMPEVTTEIISSLSSSAGSGKKILLVPQSTLVPDLPHGIQLKVMGSYGYSGGRLTWLTKRKNVKTYPCENTAST